MKNKLAKRLVALGLIAVMLGAVGCQNTEVGAGAVTAEPGTGIEEKDSAEKAKPAENTSDMSMDEISEKYAEVLDYAMFLEQEVVRLNEEVRTLSEQNDILQKKLMEQ